MNTDASEYSCEMCGRCCWQDIPLTIYDIHRIAMKLGIDDREVFERSIGEKIAPRVITFTLNRKEDGSCIYLDEDQKCSIYSFRPRVCSFYPCPDISKKDKDLWRRLYLSSACYQFFWEHSMAVNYTKEYIQRFGTNWNEDGYFEILDELKHYIITQESEKIIVASDENGSPIMMKYNCTKCKMKECRMETEITLMDILRIAQKTKNSIQDIFMNAVSKQPHSYTGGLKLRKTKGGTRCVYKSKKGHCKIYSFRPNFCKFVPCRMRVSNKKIWERFFFAAGNIEDQWQLEVSIAVTREYVKEIGVRYNKISFERYIEKINILMKNNDVKEKFIRKIDQYRYDKIPIEPVL